MEAWRRGPYRVELVFVDRDSMASIPVGLVYA
jgi:hypothetical protein